MAKATIKITLDDRWNEYTEINKELFLEDLFSTWRKDGVENVELVNLEKQ